MTFREKMLYHQIHPAKLATDIGVNISRLLSLLAASDGGGPWYFIAAADYRLCGHSC